MASPEMEATPQAETPVSVSSSEAVNDLKLQCQEKWDQIKEHYEKNADLQKPETVDKENPVSTILCKKEKQIRGEIELLKTATPNCLPSNPVILHEALAGDLKTSLSQLKEVLTLIKSQNKELTEQQQHEEETLMQLESVHTCINLKLEGLEHSDEHEVTVSSVMRELDEKIRKSNTITQSLTKTLVQFVNTHFPLPDEKTLKNEKKKLRSDDRKKSRQDLLPFKVLLQELMNKCIDEPHDPYIFITDRFWPPYVELLLRCQLVLRHPEDYQQIKLVPFHL